MPRLSSHFRVVFFQHPEERILVTAVVCQRVAFRRTAHAQQVRLVHELRRRHRNTVLPAEIQQQPRLCRIPAAVRLVVAHTVAHRDQQAAIHSLDEIQDALPLLPGQHILEPLRCHAAGVAVEIIVGLGRPGSAGAHPDRTQRPGQGADPGLAQIDRRVGLQHLAAVQRRRELLRARDLLRRVCLPEGTAGDLRHLNVVGGQRRVGPVQQPKRFRFQRDFFCHLICSFPLLSFSP